VLLLFLCALELSAQGTKSVGLTLLDAVGSSVLKHPALRAQEAQIEFLVGTREQASGAFDWLSESGLGRSRQSALGSSSQLVDLTNETSFSASTSRLFRDGIVIGPSFQLHKTSDNLSFPGGTNTYSMGLQLTVPLLRGRGRNVVAAQEGADNLQLKAGQYDLNFLVSQVMANAAASYWNLVAAHKRLAIAQEAEARGGVYVESTRALIDADHVPRNDLNEAVANLAQRSSARIVAELAIATAQQQLKLDMGLSAADMANLLPLPTDEFPPSSGVALPSDTKQSLQYYVDEALQRRGDYLAGLQRSKASRVLLAAAHNALLPQANVTVTAGYSSYRQLPQAVVPPPNTSAGEPSISANISYSFPFQNTAAHGALRQAQATAKQTGLQADELARDIGQSIMVAVFSVRLAAARTEEAQRSVEFFRASLTGAREKYRVGLGSVVEILTIEDKLTGALEDKVDAELSFALALTQFRFATGTLVTPSQATQSVPVENFLTAPFTEAPESHP
jgi:outer membrane protein TolC